MNNNDNTSRKLFLDDDVEIKEPLNQLIIPNFQQLEDEQSNEMEDESTQFQQQDENANDTEDEGIECYKIGGYHPTYIGEMMGQRYVIIQKLGWGHFSTVWLAKDFKYDTYVALKIQKSAPHYLEALEIHTMQPQQAYDEVEILQTIKNKLNHPTWIASLKSYIGSASFTPDDCHVVQLLNAFIHKGPFGNHFVMVFEILGVNLHEVIKKYSYKGIGQQQCKSIIKQVSSNSVSNSQVLIGLDYLHRICGVIHTDIKPENILVCLSPDEIVFLILDINLLERNCRIWPDQLKLEITSENQNILAKSWNQLELEPSKLIRLIWQNIQFSNTEELSKKQKKQQKKRKLKKKKQLEKQILANNGDSDEQSFNTNSMGNVIFFDATGVYINTAKSIENFHLIEQQKRMGLFNEKPKFSQNILKVKIADLGNGCWINYHFSDLIQTRNYMAPEVILGNHYSTAADIWSLACMLFEIITGEYLFDPKKGPHYSKNDDHLAQVQTSLQRKKQIQELLHKFPKKFSLVGRNSKKYFKKDGSLRRIDTLTFQSLKELLHQKYKIQGEESKLLIDFLLSMLNVIPEKRLTAQQLLHHPWLNCSTSKSTNILKKNIFKIDSLESSDYEADLSVNGDESTLVPQEKRIVDIRTIDRSFTDLGYFG